LFFLRFGTFHGFHFCFNCFLNKLQFFLFSVEFDPNWKGSSFFCGENAAFPHTQDCIHSEFIFEKWNVNRSGKFLIDSGLDQVFKQLISLKSIHRWNVLTYGYQIVPKGRSFHESIVAVFFLTELVDHWWRLRWRIRVPDSAISQFIEIILALSDAFLYLKSGKNWQVFFLGHHAFGEFDAWKSIFAVNGHFG
jgi:hypothetical protein